MLSVVIIENVYILDKTLALSIICCKCDSNDEKY